MSVPKIGAYAPLNNTMKITIVSVDPDNGLINGTYVHNFTPEGVITVSGKVGGYAWVKNNGSGGGTAPFHINFTASVRPDGWPYCIVDFWNGFYTHTDSLVLTGTRSYVKDDGTTKSIGLGTLELYLQS